MTMVEDHRLAEARAIPIGRVVDLLEIGGLTRGSVELVGPCPECGGHDRFGVNLRKGLFQCRKCGAKGDGIAMVRWLRRCSLPEALTWLCGPSQDLSDDERRARAARAAAARARETDETERFRARAIAEARRIWREALPAGGSPVRDYLALRGITPALMPTIPPCLRYHPDLPYMVRTDAGWVEAHRGPAMIAAIQAPDGTGAGVHRTWFDLSRPRGKAVIAAPNGAVQKVKKTWGSKKGGAIRLHTPARSWDTLVMAEGIETTLTAMVAGALPDAAFWSGVDLGNLSGRRIAGPGQRYSGLPDLGDDGAFVPPPHVRQLVLIEDGDSDPRLTRAQLEAGARRAMALIPGLRARIVPCPEGLDLNDVLLQGETVDA